MTKELEYRDAEEASLRIQDADRHGYDYPGRAADERTQDAYDKKMHDAYNSMQRGLHGRLVMAANALAKSLGPSVKVIIVEDKGSLTFKITAEVKVPGEAKYNMRGDEIGQPHSRLVTQDLGFIHFGVDRLGNPEMHFSEKNPNLKDAVESETNPVEYVLLAKEIAGILGKAVVEKLSEAAVKEAAKELGELAVKEGGEHIFDHLLEKIGEGLPMEPSESPLPPVEPEVPEAEPGAPEPDSPSNSTAPAGAGDKAVLAAAGPHGDTAITAHQTPPEAVTTVQDAPAPLPHVVTPADPVLDASTPHPEQLPSFAPTEPDAVSLDPAHPAEPDAVPLDPGHPAGPSPDLAGHPDPGLQFPSYENNALFPSHESDASSGGPTGTPDHPHPSLDPGNALTGPDDTNPLDVATPTAPPPDDSAPPPEHADT
ncbi:hypothetical protein ACVB8X_42770, partial [Streptomyces sp. NRAIS4]